MKRWPEAAQTYQRFLDYFPQHEQRAGATFNLATAYFNNGDYKSSLKYYQLVIDSFPQSEYAESARKNVEASRKRLGAAESEEQGTTPTDGEPPAAGEPAEQKPAPTQGDK
jgi:TolA-binding protein